MKFLLDRWVRSFRKRLAQTAFIIHQKCPQNTFKKDSSDWQYDQQQPHSEAKSHWKRQKIRHNEANEREKEAVNKSCSSENASSVSSDSSSPQVCALLLLSWVISAGWTTCPHQTPMRPSWSPRQSFVTNSFSGGMIWREDFSVTVTFISEWNKGKSFALLDPKKKKHQETRAHAYPWFLLDVGRLTLWNWSKAVRHASALSYCKVQNGG